MARSDWIAIKNEYINTSISYRKLAEKHGVSFSSLEKKARAESWKAEKEKQCDKIATRVRQKTEDKIVAKEVNRINRIASAADKLLAKLEQATDQLDNYIVTNKQKIKTIEYDNKVVGKPKREVTTEVENLAIIDGIIDRQGLKQLTAALRDLKDIQASAEGSNSAKEMEDDNLFAAIAEAVSKHEV